MLCDLCSLQERPGVTEGNTGTSANTRPGTYLNWDGSYETYQAFFSHMQSKLDDISLLGM